MGPLSKFVYPLVEVAGFRLDVRCNLLVVMRIIIINGLNGDENTHNTCEAQTLADVICDFNETFKNEENFTNSWQNGHEEEDNDFSEKVNKLFRDKTRHEQHAQQCTPEKRLRKHGKARDDAALKEMGQLHDR